MRHPRTTALHIVAALAVAAGCGSKTGLLFEPPPPEECFNGVDDDRDGEVDEGCPCAPGSIEACYDGPDGTEGVGICTPGTRSCVDDEWGACGGAVTPVPETCLGGLDEDCDGRTDCDDVEDCGDEPSCEVQDCTPHCAFEECDGRDNNGEGRIDEGRVCDGIEGPCPAAGAIRICDAYCGVHQRCRRDGSWGPCTVDNQGPVPECDEHEDCDRYSWCDYGTCVAGNPCDDDDQCLAFLGEARCIEHQGVCVTQCYAHSDCERPNVCDLGYCVPDPYAP